MVDLRLQVFVPTVGRLVYVLVPDDATVSDVCAEVLSIVPADHATLMIFTESGVLCPPEYKASSLLSQDQYIIASHEPPKWLSNPLPVAPPFPVAPQPSEVIQPIPHSGFSNQLASPYHRAYHQTFVPAPSMCARGSPFTLMTPSQPAQHIASHCLPTSSMGTSTVSGSMPALHSFASPPRSGPAVAGTIANTPAQQVPAGSGSSMHRKRRLSGRFSPDGSDEHCSCCEHSAKKAYKGPGSRPASALPALLDLAGEVAFPATSNPGITLPAATISLPPSCPADDVVAEQLINVTSPVHGSTVPAEASTMAEALRKAEQADDDSSSSNNSSSYKSDSFLPESLSRKQRGKAAKANKPVSATSTPAGKPATAAKATAASKAGGAAATESGQTAAVPEGTSATPAKSSSAKIASRGRVKRAAQSKLVAKESSSDSEMDYSDPAASHEDQDEVPTSKKPPTKTGGKPSTNAKVADKKPASTSQRSGATQSPCATAASSKVQSKQRAASTSESSSEASSGLSSDSEDEPSQAQTKATAGKAGTKAPSQGKSASKDVKARRPAKPQLKTATSTPSAKVQSKQRAASTSESSSEASSGLSSDSEEEPSQAQTKATAGKAGTKAPSQGKSTSKGVKARHPAKPQLKTATSTPSAKPASSSSSSEVVDSEEDARCEPSLPHLSTMQKEKAKTPAQPEARLAGRAASRDVSTSGFESSADEHSSTPASPSRLASKAESPSKLASKAESPSKLASKAESPSKLASKAPAAPVRALAVHKPSPLASTNAAASGSSVKRSHSESESECSSSDSDSDSDSPPVEPSGKVATAKKPPSTPSEKPPAAKTTPAPKSGTAARGPASTTATPASASKAQPSKTSPAKASLGSPSSKKKAIHAAGGVKKTPPGGLRGDGAGGKGSAGSAKKAANKNGSQSPSMKDTPSTSTKFAPTALTRNVSKSTRRNAAAVRPSKKSMVSPADIKFSPAAMKMISRGAHALGDVVKDNSLWANEQAS